MERPSYDEVEVTSSSHLVTCHSYMRTVLASQVTTGEENESNVFQLNAKLYAFDSTNRGWLEKGRGALRLNDMQSDDRSTTFQSRLGTMSLAHNRASDLLRVTSLLLSCSDARAGQLASDPQHEDLGGSDCRARRTEERSHQCVGHRREHRQDIPHSGLLEQCVIQQPVPMVE